MRIPDALVIQLLKNIGHITDEQIAALREQENIEKKPLQDLVIKNNITTEAELTKLYALEIDVPFVEFDPKELKPEMLKLIPERIAKQYRAVVFDQAPDGVKQVAMADPDDVQATNFLRKQLGANIKLHLATATTISSALDQYRGSINSELPKVVSVDDADEQAEQEVSAEDLAENSPIAQTVNVLIEYAVKANASDIHIEPREKYVLVRYRIDGVLREVNKLPHNVLGALVSRIKILSNLKIDERRVPQDGRFKVEVEGQVYALRVSTLPIVDGEKVALRILNESAKAADFNQLGFWGNAQRALEKAIIQPHGMILITGPTGSGKSTSLFSILSSLNKPGVNISTVEDPVEYRVPGVNQTQVNPKAGMTFANGLRALLRQDPNIIMVGEIRDAETANLAVQAALTGHLVLTTLHTNNAATSLPRLLDMGIEPFLIASTVRVTVGQRLVRKLCITCRIAFQPDESSLKDILDTFGLVQSDSIAKINNLEQVAIKAGVGNGEASPEPGSSPTAILKLWKAKEGGCEACDHSGYKGRMGIYEVLENTPDVQKQIIGSATSEDIQLKSIANGMVSMQTDGFIKALRGLTSIEEILRVTSET